jgi:hypothetical protein
MKAIKAFGLAAMLASGACGNSTDKSNEVVTDGTADDAVSELASCPPAAAAACGAGAVKDAAGNCQYSGADGVVVSGTARDFQSDRELNAAIVNFVDNATGKPTGICGKTDAMGKLAIKVPKGKKLAYATSYETAKETYQFNLQYDAASEEDFFSVSEVTAQLIPGLIGFTPDETKGIVAGTVLNQYGDSITADAAAHKLLVRTAKGNKAFYFKDDLPADIETQDRLNAENALFVVFDLAPGTQTLELTYDGAVTTTTDNQLAAFPDSVAISNIRCTACSR